MRFVGERRALATAVLAFYGFVYLLLSLNAPPGWGGAMTAMAGVYGLAFFGLVASYFWARWYAIGVALSGLISGVVSLWQLGPEPILMFFAGTHAFAAALLWGDTMATTFDGQKTWRERFHMDEHATNRLGRHVIRIGISLPYVLLYALAPRQDAGSILLGLTALGLVGVGAWAVLRMRSWGLAALAGAAGILAFAGATGVEMSHVSGGVAVNASALATIGALMLTAALAPFAGPVVRFLRA